MTVQRHVRMLKLPEVAPDTAIVRDFLKVYGVVLIFAMPCGGVWLFAGSVDSTLPTVGSWTASQVVLGAAALAVLGYAIHRHRTR